MRHLTRKGWIKEYAGELCAMNFDYPYAVATAHHAAQLEAKINSRFPLLWGDATVLAQCLVIDTDADGVLVDDGFLELNAELEQRAEMFSPSTVCACKACLAKRADRGEWQAEAPVFEAPSSDNYWRNWRTA